MKECIEKGHEYKFNPVEDGVTYWCERCEDYFTLYIADANN